MSHVPTVLYEDNHLLVVVKPAGLLSQGDRTGDPSLVEWAQDDLRRRFHKSGNVYIGLVHRLDRPASGVMVLARTSKAAGRLAAQFRERDAVKIYWAVVEGRPAAAATLKQRLQPGRGTQPTRVVTDEAAQEAVLHYRVLAAAPRGTLLEVTLETGRKHQIRAQLAHAGHPIVGDRRYGAHSPYRPGAIMLHARALTIAHPTRHEAMTFLAPPPPDWGVATD